MPRHLTHTLEPAVCEDEVVTSPGGAMTDEVGVIIGEVTVRTLCLPTGQVTVDIHYTGAEDTRAALEAIAAGREATGTLTTGHRRPGSPSPGVAEPDPQPG